MPQNIILMISLAPMLPISPLAQPTAASSRLMPPPPTNTDFYAMVQERTLFTKLLLVKQGQCQLPLPIIEAKKACRHHPQSDALAGFSYTFISRIAIVILFIYSINNLIINSPLSPSSLITPLSFGEGLGVRLLGGEAVLLIRLNSIHKSELYAVGIIILQTALVRIVKLATYVS